MIVPVGLNVWSRLVEATFPYFDRTVGPFDSLWMPDHVQYNGHKVAEGWTLLVWALARYPDKLGGHEVLCNSFRNPAHVAKMVATAHALSGGRAVLGIGAGWNEEEYRAYGWPFPPAPVRIAQLAEAIPLIRRLWTDSPATYEGQHYRIENAHCEPRPRPLPPIMVGGHGEKHLLRVVAQHADWWNYPFRDHALYAHKQEVLKAHCREVGRDYDQIVQVVRVGILIADTEREVERLRTSPGIRPMDDIRLAGTPAQVIETLQAIVRQGADRLVVNFADAPGPDGTMLFSETVLPYLLESP
ncbi:MAG TPA: LLM class flavin-dependent oxidoreductase [Methylomirabilota bacterium]|jgi:alkanesulfonate monooxygenase SsuD/methylene tetrahydromethanopterin reductase-like flavin-dependent oxidoreductase (luciferase family)